MTTADHPQTTMLIKNYDISKERRKRGRKTGEVGRSPVSRDVMTINLPLLQLVTSPSEFLKSLNIRDTLNRWEVGINEVLDQRRHRLLETQTHRETDTHTQPVTAVFTVRMRALLSTVPQCLSKFSRPVTVLSHRWHRDVIYAPPLVISSSCHRTIWTHMAVGRSLYSVCTVACKKAI